MRYGAVWVLVFASLPAVAHAGGFTVPGTGPIALGRGGANLARAEGAWGLWYNPALLAESQDVEITAAANVFFYEPCISRSGSYGDNIPAEEDNDRISRFGRDGDYAGEAFPTVCREGGPGVSPHLAGTFRAGDRVGVGIGIISPTGSGENQFGQMDGSVSGGNGDLRPSPLRYNLIHQDANLVRLLFGVGVRATSWLRVGVSFIWGMNFAEGVNHSVVIPGEIPSLDIRSNLRNMRDLFIPGIIGSVHVVPHDNVDIGLRVFWSDDVHTRGQVRLTSGTFGAETPVPRTTVPSTMTIDGVTLRVPQPIELQLGIRYASRYEPRDEVHPVRDPLHDERWDVELVAGYERTSRIDAFHIRVPAGHQIPVVQVNSAGMETTSMFNVREQTDIEKGFRDQFTLYAGGDWNAVRDRFAVRGGLSFETRGIEPALAQPDFLPGRRVGLHAGFTVRPIPSLDISAAYAHIFQEDLVADPAGSDGPNPAEFRQAVSVGTGAIVNAGRYRVRWDIVSIAATMRF